ASAVIFSPLPSLKKALIRCVTCSSGSGVFTSSLSIVSPPPFPFVEGGAEESTPLSYLWPSRIPMAIDRPPFFLVRPEGARHLDPPDRTRRIERSLEPYERRHL